MKIIKPAIPIVLSLSGFKSREDNVDYRLTKNSISVPCDEGTLIYNTLTGMLILIKKDESINENLSELIKYGLYVPVLFNENKLADDIFNLAKSLNADNRPKTTFTVLTTMDCNARCFYCYELGRKRTSMSEEIAYDTADYIVKQCNGNEVSLHWFGGEPLYNKKVIDIISDSLRDKGIPFHSQMISNGYYLDEETCKTAKEKWNLKQVQITIDGTKDIYQKTKAYIEKDPNAFERVIGNIKSVLKNDIYVTIRLNVDHDNAKDMHKLVEFLSKELKDYSNYHVYAALLKPIAGKIHSFESSVQEFEEYEALLDVINGYGMGKIAPLEDKLKLNLCAADSDSSEVLLPDGKIGKCQHYSETNLIGSIYSDDYDLEMINSWKEVVPKFDECEECPLYPRCRMLKKCDYARTSCDPETRMRGEKDLERRILAEYNKYKKKGSI